MRTWQEVAAQIEELILAQNKENPSPSAGTEAQTAYFLLDVFHALHYSDSYCREELCACGYSEED